MPQRDTYVKYPKLIRNNVIAVAVKPRLKSFSIISSRISASLVIAVEEVVSTAVEVEHIKNNDSENSEKLHSYTCKPREKRQLIIYRNPCCFNIK